MTWEIYVPATLIVFTWVIGGRLIYTLTRDLADLRERVARLEGRGDREP